MGWQAFQEKSRLGVTMEAQGNIRTESIPWMLNIALTLSAISVSLFLLWFASHTRWWGWALVAAVVFSYTNNTTFSLLHESVHGIFHPNRTINEWFGRLNAAFFPTALTFQRIFHLGHHRRNRTDAELFDYYSPHDNRFLKYVQWYGILTAVYWVVSPVACLLYLLCPWVLHLPLFRGDHSKIAQQTGADAMLSGFENAPGLHIRSEILFSILVQAAMVYLLDLTLFGWLLCYGAFALNWSSLQYADHAWSVRNVYDGAWNLKVNKAVQYVFLNYHHHRAHHQNPQVSWIHLSRYVDFSEDRPSFLKMYLRMWLGPRPYPGQVLDEAKQP